MKRFVEGVERSQSTLFPDRLEDWIGDDNPGATSNSPRAARASCDSPASFVSASASSLCLANSYYVYKSPLFHRLVNPSGNGTIWVHA